MNNVSLSTNFNANHYSNNNSVNKYVNTQINGIDKYTPGNKSLKKNKNNISPVKKMMSLILSGTLLLGGAKACTGNKISDNDNIDGTKIEYVNVKKETRDSIAIPLITLKSKLNKNNDFLKDVNISIAGSYKDLNDDHSFKTYLKNQEYTDLDKGINFYSDSNLQKIIIVQADPHDNFGGKALSETAGLGYSDLPSLRHTLMHEVGHQFDEYFGHDHNAKFAKEWDNILKEKEHDSHRNPYTYENETPAEEEIGVEYKWNSGLSDKSEFQEAILKDLKHVAKLKKQNSSHLACNVDYYTQSIDFTKPITYYEVDLADVARSEVYANLFAYAIGENDGDKEDFVENFKNSYKVVQKDIQKYLNIKAK